MAAIAALALLLTSPITARDFPGVPLPERVPLEVSWYDPALSGINCNGDCTFFGNGERVTAAHYWQRAACPRHWIGATLIVESPHLYGEFFCHEGGGAIDCRQSARYGRRVCRVDILADTPIRTGLVYRWRLTRQ